MVINPYEYQTHYGYDRDGNTVRMGYNLDGNMVLASGTPGGLGAPAISSIYRYDARGFLTSAMEGNTAYHYKRDSEGRVTEKADSRGRLFEVVYNPDGTIGRLGGTRYYYNFVGQMTCVMSDCGLGANYEYDNNGALIKTECDNGLTTTYTRDSRGRLESLKAGFAGETALLDAKYTYDGNGNRTSREELFFMEKGSVPTSAVTQYAYDSMNRLTMENRNGLATTYTYDMAGNRTSRLKGDDREEYRYNSRNQLTELTGMGRRTSCQYDPAGNLTQEQRFIQERAETRKYTYDAYNRNTEVRGEDFLHRNFYDAEGLRNRIEENGKATDFVYSGDMLYSEKDINSRRECHYILGNEYLGHEDLVQDVTFASENQKQEYSYITDEQGSLRYILNTDRQMETYQEYSAFGERIWQEGAYSRLGYNSQMGDELTGLTYLRARYYNPEIGRFTQEDVIYDDGFNLYAYCGSNPVIYCDPSGFEEEKILVDLANCRKDGGGTVWTGKDKYVPELANSIEKKFPGKVKSVERLLYGEDGKLITDLDIELEDIVIQVKSGSAKKLTKQMINTANATGKTVISYTPDIKQSAIVLRGVRENGFKTFTTEKELLEYLEEIYK